MANRNHGQTSYRGKWILTPDFSLLADAYLVCADNKIQQVTRNRPDGKILEHDGLILPGLVNAHSHLEFSDLDRPLGDPGEPFVSWIGKVIGHRNSRNPDLVFDAIESGLNESTEAGVAAIGEISTFDWHGRVQSETAILDFREIIGFRKEQHDEISNQVHTFETTRNSQDDWQLGVSPHAPYSINRDSLEFAVNWSNRQQAPLAMHLAESTEELELLAEHRGPFFDLLIRLGLWTDANFKKGTRPLHFLRLLANAHRSLVIHGNYLDSEELNYVAANQSTLRLVYCPRTHAFFRHREYPLQDIVSLGIPLSLGTDSRASNPDLSLWNEMTFVHDVHSIPPLEILKMGTIHGAVSLGLENLLGTLEPGKRASVFLAPGMECEFVREIVGGD